MIKYQLNCGQGCDFEAWFKCSETFEIQSAMQQIECPHCGISDVQKSVMAPRIAKKSACQEVHPRQEALRRRKLEDEITEVLRQFRADVKARSDDVGDQFAGEVRKMHQGDVQQRSIWGTATRDEIKDLVDDEIDVVALPRLPEDAD